MLLDNPSLNLIVTFLRKHLHTWVGAGVTIGYIGTGPNRDDIIDMRGRGYVHHTFDTCSYH